MPRFYFCEVAEFEDDQGAYYAAACEEIFEGRYKSVEGRALNADGTIPATGIWFVQAEPDAAQHAACLADPRITYLSIEDSNGNPLDVMDTIGAIAPVKRAAILSLLETHHIPTDGLTVADPIAKLLKAISRRFALRQILRDYDLTENLNTPLSELPQGKLAEVKARLDARGADTRGIDTRMTVRQALRELMDR